MFTGIIEEVGTIRQIQRGAASAVLHIQASLIPDDEKLGGQSYWNLKPEGDAPGTQYGERFKYMKNTDGQNHDNKNYWHHVANAWNWDEPSRWWGQIAGVN